MAETDTATTSFLEAKDGEIEDKFEFDGDEDDQQTHDELVSWLAGNCQILPSKIKRYSAQFVKEGVGSIKRLAKKIKKTPDFLESVGIAIDDADEISEVLSREGIFEAIRNEQLAALKATEAENEAPALAAAPIVTRARAPSLAPPIAEAPVVELRSRQGTILSETEVPAYLNNPYAYTYVADQADDDLHPGSSRPRRHTQFTQQRKLSEAKLDTLAQEVIEVMQALKLAVDEQDDTGCCDALEYIAEVVENNVDRQKAFQRAAAHLGVLSAMNAFIGNTEACESACRCIALLCRCSDDKGSTNYEFCKEFGLRGASDSITNGFKKHSEHGGLVKEACDAIRSMCNLNSNKQRFHDSGACEVIAGALATFSADPALCAWICRTIGHLAQSNDASKEVFGENLVAPNLILALQNHQKNDQVCTEIFWAIRNLAYENQSNRQRFITDFGPESIIVAFSRHVQVEVLTVEATTALVALVSGEDDEVIGRIANSGAMTFVSRALRKNPECESLAYRAFQLLYFCAAYKNSTYQDLIKRKLTSNDFLECMSTAFENHAGDAGVAEWGCRLLHEIVDNDANIQGRMRNAGLCEMVVSAVQRQAISEGICEVGCLAIGDLALEVANHDRLAAAGACEAACGALRRHDDNVEVIIQACYAIHYLAFTQNNVGWIGANGGCEAVAEALEKHKENSRMTIFAVRALGSLAFKDEGNMVRIFEAGGCAAVVVALRNHPKDREVCEACCRAIYNLSGDNANVKDLGEKGACGLVVSALVAHMNVEDVAEKACLAISGLAIKTRGDKEHKGNTRKLVARGAVENVVACIQKYPENAMVVRAGAMAVTSLSRMDANRLKVGATGVVDMLIAALSQHSLHAECVAKVARAIDMLSVPVTGENGVVISDVNKDKFCQAGVAELLVSLLRKHERSREVVVEVLRALITLATHPLARKHIWTDEACKLFVKVMKLHEKEEDVARWACDMIYSQAIDNAARVRLGLAKACEGVVAVLAKHAVTAPNVVRYACRAMCGLAELDANKKKFNTTETCTSLVISLSKHIDDADVAEWACFSIVSVSSNQGNRQKFYLAGACPVVNKVLAKHVDSEIVTTLAFEAIRELSYFVDNRVQLGAVGTNETVAKAFERHLDSHEVATHACRAIAGIAFQHGANAAKLGNAGCCELLLRGLRLHWSVSSFIEWSMSAIAVMSEKQKSNQTIFSEGDIAKLFVSALLHHSASDGVCFQGAKAVRCLTLGNFELKNKMALAGIAPVVLSCLQRHEKSGLVTENACWVLGNILCFEGMDDVNRILQDELAVGDMSPVIPAPFSSPSTPRAPKKPKPSTLFYGSAGHWDTLVTALTVHMNRPQTVRWVCAAIACFADRSRTENLRCCEAAIQALALHADALSVCNKVLLCIGALAHSHVKNAGRLGKLKACEEVASLLTRSEEEPSIHGCFAAIAGLSNCSTANQARFSAVPTLSKDIVQKLYDMLEHPNVARWGCASISALCWNNNENQSKLGKASNFIADIIETHIKSRAIVRDAVRAVSCLAHNHITNRNRLGASGCCEWVPKITANPLYSADSTVVVWCVRAVADLAANNPNNQTKLGVNGACEALVKAITQSWGSMSEEETLAKYSLWAIGNLVQLKDSHAGLEGSMGLSIVMSAGNGAPPVKNTTRFADAGIVAAIMALVAKFESSAAVVRWSCRAVNNLGKSHKIRAQFNQLRARWVLEALSRRYSTDNSVAEWSNLALETLIHGPPKAPVRDDSATRTRADSSSGRESPRTSFSAVVQSLNYITDAATSLGGSADKAVSKSRSKSWSDKEATEAKKETKKHGPGTKSRISTGAAPGAATSKTLAALSAATAATPIAKKNSRALPVDTPKTTMPDADPPTTNEGSPAGATVAGAKGSATPDGVGSLESKVTTPLVLAMQMDEGYEFVSEGSPSVDDL